MSLKKNPSPITVARRLVDKAILGTAGLISQRLAEKSPTLSIAVVGHHLYELYQIGTVLVSHERANQRALKPEVVQHIHSIVKPLLEKGKKYDGWLGAVVSLLEK